jgi:hypothetical protein
VTILYVIYNVETDKVLAYTSQVVGWVEDWEQNVPDMFMVADHKVKDLLGCRDGEEVEDMFNKMAARRLCKDQDWDNITLVPVHLGEYDFVNAVRFDKYV